MELVLVRHAPAEARDPQRWPDDSRRELTKDGRRVAEAIGRGLEAIGVHPSRILTSPAVRCRETAELLQRGLGSHLPLEEWEPLSFGTSPQLLLQRVATASRSGSGPHILVGHEPSLGRLATLLCFGEAVASVRLKRGGAAAIETPRRPAPGSGRLQWVLTRRQLVGLGESGP